MSYVATKGQFHVALNGVGLLLQGAPDRLGYQQAQAPVYGQRFASGDRSYNDLSQWWYYVQTDWSGGEKDDIAWADDAKYYYSTNIDAFSENGAIKLMAGLSLENDFTDEIVVGSFETVVATGINYVGTNKSTSTKPAIFSAGTLNGTWANISSAWMPTTASFLTEIIAHKLKLWFSTFGAGSTYVIGKCNDDGTSNVDYSAAIGTACDGITPTSSFCIGEDGNVLYAHVRGATAENYIVKTIDGGSNWVKVLLTGYEVVISILPIGANIYFLSLVGNILRFKVYNTASTVTTTIYTFPAQSNPMGTPGYSGTSSRRALQLFNGKIVVTKRDNIWEYDLNTGDFARVYNVDDNKSAISISLAVADPTGGFRVNGYHTGAVLHNDRLWWVNLIYDNQGRFYNGKRDFADSDSTYGLKPLFSNGTTMLWTDNNDFTKLYKDNAYKGTADKSYIVFNNFDTVSGVDKLAYSATIIFRPLISGQSIVVEYLLGELTSASTWTALGTASYAIDGGVVTDKTFFFPTASTFKKIWIRIKLNGSGSDTPVCTDFVSEYLPVPTYRKLWSLNINAGDSVKSLDGTLHEKTGREIRAMLENAWWTKSILDYQDLDYGSTTITDSPLSSSAATINVGSTVDFPEQGRLRCGDEEIFYTSKTPHQFLGCTRGARGSRAVSHLANAVINNAFKVIITELGARVPISLQDKELEYTVGITLREV